MKTNIKRTVYTVVSGFAMGTAEVIPGVSGSTIALIFRIYTQFVHLLFSISELVKIGVKVILRKASVFDFKEGIHNIDLGFAIPLAIGTVLAIGTMTSIILIVLEKYPHYLYAVLFGLILSVIIIPWKEMDEKGWKEVLTTTVTFGILFYVLGRGVGDINSNPSYLLLFFGGMVAISGMVLPGISGSLILLILGIYYYIINLIKSFVHLDFNSSQIFDFIVFTLGVAVGFVFLSQILKKALEKHKSLLMAFILGLVLGSTRVLWPFVGSHEIDGEFEIIRLPISDFTSLEVTIILVTVITLAVSMSIFNYRSSEKLD